MSEVRVRENESLDSALRRFKRHGSLTLVIEDLLFNGLKSLNFFVKF